MAKVTANGEITYTIQGLTREQAGLIKTLIGSVNLPDTQSALSDIYDELSEHIPFLEEGWRVAWEKMQGPGISNIRVRRQG